MVNHTNKSIPKWLLPNPALVQHTVRAEGLKNFTFENLVGCHLLNVAFGKKNWQLTYWREKAKEIDFILSHDHTPALTIEVKSGRKKPPISKVLLAAAGITSCPTLVVTPRDADRFFYTHSLEGIVALGA